MILDGAGYEVHSFTSPMLALENFKSAFYDLVLLDIKMPEMDGFELRRQIRKIDSAVKVCFITASELYYKEFRKELVPEEDRTLDKDRFLRKPIQNEELIKEITGIINSN